MITLHNFAWLKKELEATDKEMRVLSLPHFPIPTATLMVEDGYGLIDLFDDGTFEERYVNYQV